MLGAAAAVWLLVSWLNRLTSGLVWAFSGGTGGAEMVCVRDINISFSNLNVSLGY